MKKLLFIVMVLCATLVIAQEPIYDYFAYLPLVVSGSTPAPTATPRVWDCSHNRYNCGNFSSQAEAQACYEYCMIATGQDIHGLDGDSDGIVCEVYSYPTPTSTPEPTVTPTETLIPTETPTETPTFTATPTLTVTVTITVAS